MNNISLEAIVQVIVYGVPALLIVLGFVAYMMGYGIEMSRTALGQQESAISGVGLMNTGSWLMAIGIILYVIELILKFVTWYYEQ